MRSLETSDIPGILFLLIVNKGAAPKRMFKMSSDKKFDYNSITKQYTPMTNRKTNETANALRLPENSILKVLNYFFDKLVTISFQGERRHITPREPPS